MKVDASGREVSGQVKRIGNSVYVLVEKCKGEGRQGEKGPGPQQEPPDPTTYTYHCSGQTLERPVPFYVCDLHRLLGARSGATPTRPQDIEPLIRELAIYLRLPDTPPHFGPNPNNNEWKMLAVGYPVWLWVDGPTTKSTTASASGLTFQLTARRTGTTFTMGDGTTLHCSTTTRYRRDVTPGTPSPTCGHVYKKPSLPGGPYTVTATAHWTITWNVAGLSGTFPLNYSDSAQLRIGELQALVR